MTSLKVIHTNILVQEIKAEEGTIVSVEEDDIIRGTVKEIGDGNSIDGTFSPMLVRPQNIVWFDKHLATKLPFCDDLYVLDQSSILIIEED